MFKKFLILVLIVCVTLFISSCSVFKVETAQTETISDDSTAADPNVVINILLEEARKEYVNALKFRTTKSVEEAINSFENSLKIINSLSYYPEIENNDAYSELDNAVKDDYKLYVESLDELPENVSLFAYEEWLRKEIPDTLETTEEIEKDIETKAEINLNGFKLEINNQVEKYIEYFTGRGRKHMNNWLARSGKFFPMMAKIFAEEQVPQQLIFLSMIESGLVPHAKSWASAVGLWQFIKSTGMAYDLKVNFYIDERRDPEKATRAAARHLRDLYYQYGDWLVVLSTYNCSPARVRSSIKKAGSSNFWKYQRYLPKETKNYVPQYIAATLIASQPEKYGFENIQYEKLLDYSTYNVKNATDLSVLAKCAGVSVDILKDLNPELIQNSTPPNLANGYELKIPRQSYDMFVENLNSVPEEARQQFVMHEVKKGETLNSIAKKYKVSVTQLAKLNNVTTRTKVYPEVELRIPIAQSTTFDVAVNTDLLPAIEEESQQKVSEAPYKIILSDDFGDDDKYAKIYQEVLNDTTKIIPEGKERIQYTVKKLDNIISISELFDVRSADIRNWNGIPYTSNVKVGQVIDIYVDNDRVAYYQSIENLNQKDKLTLLNKDDEGGWVTHKIRKGEKLAKIAKKYGVTQKELKSWNNLKSGRLIAGKTLQIYMGDNSKLASLTKTSNYSKSGIEKYKVRRGDVLSNIALRYKVSLDDLKRWNNLKNNNIRIGQRLKIYGNENVVSYGDNAAKTDGNFTFYTVKTGDVISKIAEEYKVKTSELKEWNNLKDNKIKVGEKLKIYSDVAIATASSDENEKTSKNNIESGKTDIHYIVKVNDTVGKIALKYNVSENDINEWNNLKNSRIKIGDELIIKPTKAKTETKRNLASAKTHTVQKGDTLGEIAETYGMTARELRKINKLSNNKIRPGQKLKVM